MDIRWENILVSHLKVIPEYRDAAEKIISVSEQDK